MLKQIKIISLFIFLQMIFYCNIAYCNDNSNLEYTTILNENNEIILQTGIEVNIDDEFINEQNQLYKVTSVNNNEAKAKFIENINSTFDTIPSISTYTANNSLGLISIYHTHTDESFIPTSGKALVPGKGDVMKVGETFAKKLEQVGYSVNHNTSLHEPHDANAYHRSRRTAVKLLKEDPIALFDIHRDSAPIDMYATTIDGDPAAKIMIIVGKQNQNKNTTRDFALKIKEAADKAYPKLIRGIFMAHGNYNQDLSPHAILLEIGSDRNSLEQVQKTVEALATITPKFLNNQSPNTVSADSGINNINDNTDANNSNSSFAHYKDIFIILMFTILGTIIYLFLSFGSIKELKNKALNFRKHEFSNFLCKITRRKK